MGCTHGLQVSSAHTPRKAALLLCLHVALDTPALAGAQAMRMPECIILVGRHITSMHITSDALLQCLCSLAAVPSCIAHGSADGNKKHVKVVVAPANCVICCDCAVACAAQLCNGDCGKTSMTIYSRR